jgi:hypothetical protein
MFTKTMIAVSVAIVLGAASATLASDRESGGGYQVQTWQGIQRMNHPFYVTDAGHAYGLVESSKPEKPSKKKLSKPEKTLKPEKASSKPETDAQARQRHYYDNR